MASQAQTIQLLGRQTKGTTDVEIRLRRLFIVTVTSFITMIAILAVIGMAMTST